MPSIREECERVRQPTPDDLGHHVAHRQKEYDSEATTVAATSLSGLRTRRATMTMKQGAVGVRMGVGGMRVPVGMAMPVVVSVRVLRVMPLRHPCLTEPERAEAEYGWGIVSRRPERRKDADFLPDAPDLSSIWPLWVQVESPTAFDRWRGLGLMRVKPHFGRERAHRCLGEPSGVRAGAKHG